jgi:hypothetical protein
MLVTAQNAEHQQSSEAARSDILWNVQKMDIYTILDVMYRADIDLIRHRKTPQNHGMPQLKIIKANHRHAPK